MTLVRRVLSRRLPKWLVPTFFISGTLLIAIFNDVFAEKDAYVVISLLFFCLMFIVAIRWMVLQFQYILKLKREKKEAELLHLKSQVNPHFLFNTLNNLYGLVGQDTTKAQQLILKLSDMMRYSIYEGQNDLVSLGQEIDYIKHYLELQEMRYHKQIDIKFEMEVEDNDVKLMPLLFIILVENAFKHGVENLRHDAYVHIDLKATQNQLSFKISNNFDHEEISEMKGIGLANLKRRLELVYPKKFKFESQAFEQAYHAELILELI